MIKLDSEADSRSKPAGRIRQQNESIILRAAEVEFANSGFKGASMNDIAQRAGLPKANLHYYFKNKLGLYIAVLNDVIQMWDSTFNTVTEADDPAEFVARYIERKVRFSQEHPLASRIFATELIGGASALKEHFGDEYHQWFQGRIDVFRAWAKQGRIDAGIDPQHLVFMIWAATQHYADFSVQIQAALGSEPMQESDYQTAIDTLTRIVIKGCGIA